MNVAFVQMYHIENIFGWHSGSQVSDDADVGGCCVMVEVSFGASISSVGWGQRVKRFRCEM